MQYATLEEATTKCLDLNNKVQTSTGDKVSCGAVQVDNCNEGGPFRLCSTVPHTENGGPNKPQSPVVDASDANPHSCTYRVGLVSGAINAIYDSIVDHHDLSHIDHHVHDDNDG